MSERTCVLVPGVCCEAEARMVSNTLGALPGVEGVDVDVLGRKAWVRHASAVSPADLVRALRPLELGAALVAAPPAAGGPAEPDHAGHDHRMILRRCRLRSLASTTTAAPRQASRGAS